MRRAVETAPDPLSEGPLFDSLSRPISTRAAETGPFAEAVASVAAPAAPTAPRPPVAPAEPRPPSLPAGSVEGEGALYRGGRDADRINRLAERAGEPPRGKYQLNVYDESREGVPDTVTPTPGSAQSAPTAMDPNPRAAEDEDAPAPRERREDRPLPETLSDLFAQGRADRREPRVEERDPWDFFKPVRTPRLGEARQVRLDGDPRSMRSPRLRLGDVGRARAARAGVVDLPEGAGRGALADILRVEGGPGVEAPAPTSPLAPPPEPTEAPPPPDTGLGTDPNAPLVEGSPPPPIHDVAAPSPTAPIQGPGARAPVPGTELPPAGDFGGVPDRALDFTERALDRLGLSPGLGAQEDEDLARLRKRAIRSLLEASEVPQPTLDPLPPAPGPAAPARDYNSLARVLSMSPDLPVGVSRYDREGIDLNAESAALAERTREDRAARLKAITERNKAKTAQYTARVKGRADAQKALVDAIDKIKQTGGDGAKHAVSVLNNTLKELRQLEGKKADVGVEGAKLRQKDRAEDIKATTEDRKIEADIAKKQADVSQKDQELTIDAVKANNDAMNEVYDTLSKSAGDRNSIRKDVHKTQTEFIDSVKGRDTDQWEKTRDDINKRDEIAAEFWDRYVDHMSKGDTNAARMFGDKLRAQTEDVKTKAANARALVEAIGKREGLEADAAETQAKEDTAVSIANSNLDNFAKERNLTADVERFKAELSTNKENLQAKKDFDDMALRAAEANAKGMNERNRAEFLGRVRTEIANGNLWNSASEKAAELESTEREGALDRASRESVAEIGAVARATQKEAEIKSREEQAALNRENQLKLAAEYTKNQQTRSDRERMQEIKHANAKELVELRAKLSADKTDNWKEKATFRAELNRRIQEENQAFQAEQSEKARAHTLARDAAKRAFDKKKALMSAAGKFKDEAQKLQFTKDRDELQARDNSVFQATSLTDVGAPNFSVISATPVLRGMSRTIRDLLRVDPGKITGSAPPEGRLWGVFGKRTAEYISELQKNFSKARPQFKKEGWTDSEIDDAYDVVLSSTGRIQSYVANMRVNFGVAARTTREDEMRIINAISMVTDYPIEAAGKVRGYLEQQNTALGRYAEQVEKMLGTKNENISAVTKNQAGHFSTRITEFFDTGSEMLRSMAGLAKAPGGKNIAKTLKEQEFWANIARGHRSWTAFKKRHGRKPPVDAVMKWVDEMKLGGLFTPRMKGARPRAAGGGDG